MRIGQLETLTEDELALLLYIVNVKDPVSSPKMEFSPKHVLWIKHALLLKKVETQEPNLTDEGKVIHKSLMAKLKKTWLEEIFENERAKQQQLNQPSIQS